MIKIDRTLFKNSKREYAYEDTLYTNLSLKILNYMREYMSHSVVFRSHNTKLYDKKPGHRSKKPGHI